MPLYQDPFASGNYSGVNWNSSSSLTFPAGTSTTSTLTRAPTVPIPTLGQASGATGSNNSEVQLPSWVKTNPDDMMGELLKQYSDAPNSVLKGADDLARTGNRAADYAYASGTRSASNAAADAANRAAQSGGAVGSGAIKAQLSEKAEAGRVDAKLKIAEQQQQARVQAASISTDIAKTISSLRTNYLAQLAGANATLRGQNLGYAADSTKNALSQESLSNQFTLAERELAMKQSAMDASVSAATKPPASFNTGYTFGGNSIVTPGYMG